MAKQSIIFDLDGTLIDSRAATITAFNAAMESCGETHRRSALEFMSHSGTPLLDVCRKMELPEKFADFYRTEAKRIRNTILMFPGISELLNDLAHHGFKMAVLTGKDRESTYAILRTLEIEDFFQVIVTPEDPIEPKPSPAPAIWISTALSIKPTECFMVGDSQLDIMCGNRAGMITIGCTWGVSSATQLTEAGADIVVQEVAGLRRWLFDQ